MFIGTVTTWSIFFSKCNFQFFFFIRRNEEGRSRQCGLQVWLRYRAGQSFAAGKIFLNTARYLPIYQLSPNFYLFISFVIGRREKVCLVWNVFRFLTNWSRVLFKTTAYENNKFSFPSHWKIDQDHLFWKYNWQNCFSLIGLKMRSHESDGFESACCILETRNIFSLKLLDISADLH